jgi:hypothetical protein
MCHTVSLTQPEEQWLGLALSHRERVLSAGVVG